MVEAAKQELGCTPAAQAHSAQERPAYPASIQLAD